MKRFLVCLFVSLTVAIVQVSTAVVVIAVPSGSVEVGDVVTLIADVEEGRQDPEWLATSGEWCQSRRCEWRQSATEISWGDVMFWRASVAETVVITVTNLNADETSTHTIVVED